ncbi:MAG: family 10 glycosylhydrolase [Anaerolineae bacterium]
MISVSLLPAPLTDTLAYTTYLPLVSRHYPNVTEFRGLWVTRFDWTFFGRPVTTTDLDTIVNNAASAHFNALLFQVRGTADAFYSSALEPWAARLTGQTTKTLGVDPGWDPLTPRSPAHMPVVCKFTPTSTCCRRGYAMSAPRRPPFRHICFGLCRIQRLGARGVFARRIHRKASPRAATICGLRQRSHSRAIITAVAADIVNRYDVDGLHIDLIRCGSGYSYDPFTMAAFSEALKFRRR